jgi:LysM repeat protein
MALMAGAQPPPAEGAVAHTVIEGETLSGIAAANGISTESLAAYNGISADTLVIAGTTITVPSATEVGTTSAATTSTLMSAAGGHTVVAGETLSGIAAANGISTESLAAYNGISADALVITGQTLQVPSATGTTSTASTGQPATVPASWTTEIYSPNGAAYLASNAASAWSAMRDAAVSQYGVDIYPGGPLSAFRTYEQQAYLYDLYLAGQGAPANPPGTSSHEYGTAVDVASPEMRSLIDQIGPAYGWSKVHGPDEWWHVDYVGG